MPVTGTPNAIRTGWREGFRVLDADPWGLTRSWHWHADDLGVRMSGIGPRIGNLSWFHEGMRLGVPILVARENARPNDLVFPHVLAMRVGGDDWYFEDGTTARAPCTTGRRCCPPA